MNALEIRATVGLALIYALRMVGPKFTDLGPAGLRQEGTLAA